MPTADESHFKRGFPRRRSTPFCTPASHYTDLPRPRPHSNTRLSSQATAPASRHRGDHRTTFFPLAFCINPHSNLNIAFRFSYTRNN